ncbi:MAG: ABC-2 family transporter protein [Anaerolineae bacterium]|nr:ABC-2 family transporter protein [Anaerolineae bacterium]
MRRYLALTKCAFLTGMVWRAHFIFTLISNLAYIVILYFLWKSIYGVSQTLNGMTFNQVFVYMTVTSSIFVLFKTWLEWQVSRDIISGAITTQLTKPLDHQLMVLSHAFGRTLNNALVITLPALAVLFGIFRASIPVGWNVLFFCLSLPLACLLSLVIDYIIGLTSFYTESLWGISTTKEIIVLVLSGGLVPLGFFPEVMRNILSYLPFQAIYHTPASILTDASLSLADYTSMLGVQAAWVIVLLVISRLFFSQAVKAVTINGG